MRPVEHLPVEACHAHSRSRVERCHDTPGAIDLRRRRAERGVDDRDLIRMDGELRSEAVTPGVRHFARQASPIAKVGMDTVNRLNSRGGSRD